MRYGLAERAGIIVEGAVDRFCGRPRDRNPYCQENGQEAWSSWDFGWHNADWYLDVRGEEEASRWLQDAA
jgi:hypothetical protein